MGVKMLKMAIFFKLIVEIKQKTYISYVFQARLWACGRGDTSTPSFGIYLNPISTKGGRLCPPYSNVHIKF